MDFMWNKLLVLLFEVQAGCIINCKCIIYQAGLNSKQPLVWSSKSGLQTGFTFKKGQYDPFSADIQKAYLILGRENLIKVENVLNHQQVSTGDKYQTSRDSILKKIHCHEDEIKRIVDLFSRINSAVQAEEIGTILYALEELTADNKDLVSEKTFYDYVLSWKKQWSTEEKRLSVANTIRELAAMNWIRLDYSAELPVENEGDQFPDSIQPTTV